MKSKTLFNIISIVALFTSVVLVNATSYRVDPTHPGPDEIPDPKVYDPFADVSSPSELGYPDDKIDIADVAYVSSKFGTYGNSTRNVTIVDSPSGLLGVQSTRKLAVYSITPVDIGSTAYFKAGEISVPTGEKWFIHKIIFNFQNDLYWGMVRLIIGNETMMDEVRAGTIAMITTNYGDSQQIALYVMEMDVPLEVIEGESIELWIRTTGTGHFICGLTIEAWVEQM